MQRVVSMRRINLKLPNELHEKLRAYCHAEGKTVQGALLVLIRRMVADVVVHDVQPAQSAEVRALASWERFG